MLNMAQYQSAECWSSHTHFCSVFLWIPLVGNCCRTLASVTKTPQTGWFAAVSAPRRLLGSTAHPDTHLHTTIQSELCGVSRSDVIFFQNVVPRFKLPIAHLSEDASFVSFNFCLDWRQWRSNPARIKQFAPPNVLWKQKLSVDSEAECEEQLVENPPHLHQTPLSYIQSDVQEVIWDNNVYSQHVCVCLCVFVNLVCVHLGVVLETRAANMHTKCHIMQMLHWV